MNRLVSPQKRNSRPDLPLLLVLSAIVIALPKSSEFKASPAAAAYSQASTTASSATAAMRIQVDPETGELVPATGSFESPSGPGMASPSHSVEGLQVITRPGGGRSVHLEGRFMESYIATIDSTGHTHLDCLPEQQAERSVHENSRPAPDGAVER